MSVVYFAHAKRNQRVKVGYSRNADARIAQLQTGSHEKLNIIGTVNGGRKEERRIHKLLFNYQISGEWFHIDPTVEAFIKCCINTQDIDIASMVYGDYLRGKTRTRVVYSNSAKSELEAILRNPASTVVDYQQFLRDAGLSVRESKRLGRHGWSAYRETEATATNHD